ncbi:MAG: hypothetical protein CM1200mP41_26670 [Gammaproteobacteria bacterium]|nr:MAG: hypothetical protein CM1200mP41_26670 [Gammaproteobacteria bacterium]
MPLGGGDFSPKKLTQRGVLGRSKKPLVVKYHL